TLLKYNEVVYLEVKNGEPLNYDDIIVAETKHGKFLYKVLKESYQVSKDDIVEPDGKFIRLATKDDFLKDQLNDEEAEAALSFCIDAVREENLAMHLLTSKYSLDKEKLIFFFTAKERVDFRSLVRLLAQQCNTRIVLGKNGLSEEWGDVGDVCLCC